MKKKSATEKRLDDHINLLLDDALHGTSKVDDKLREREKTLERCTGLSRFYFGDIYADVEELKTLKMLINNDKEIRKRNEKIVCPVKRKRKRSPNRLTA